MRKLALLCMIVCSGCGLLPGPENTEIGHNGIPIVSSYEEAASWVEGHIKYSSDEELYNLDDYWASPEETLEKGKGDCEDIVALYLRIVYESLGEKGTAHITQIPDGRYHMMASVNDFSFYGIKGEKEICSISYDRLQLRYGPHTFWNKRGLIDDYIID